LKAHVRFHGNLIAISERQTQVVLLVAAP